MCARFEEDICAGSSGRMGRVRPCPCRSPGAHRRFGGSVHKIRLPGPSVRLGAAESCTRAFSLSDLPLAACGEAAPPRRLAGFQRYLAGLDRIK